MKTPHPPISIFSAVLSRSADGDEPLEVTRLLATGADWWRDFLRGAQRDSGKLRTGESRHLNCRKVWLFHRRVVVKLSFRICLSSSSFMAYSRGQSVTRRTEGVLECKWRERADFSESRRKKDEEERRQISSCSERRASQNAQTDVRTSVWRQSCCYTEIPRSLVSLDT